MSLNQLFQNALDYSRDNVAVSIAAAVALVIIFIKKRTLIYVLIIALLVVMGVTEIFRMLESIRP